MHPLHSVQRDDRSPAGRLDGMPAGRDPQSPGGDFGALVAAEVPGLYRYALSIAGERALAEDLVSDTVLRALERHEQFRGEASLRTWLHRILYHLSVDRARHSAHEVSADEVEELWSDSDYTVDASVVAERAESASQMRDALMHLPQHYRTVVVLHDAEAWGTGEVAELLGISVAATKQRLRRGRMMLVSSLARGQERREANTGVPLSCWDARRKVSDYLDNALGQPERAALEAHLAKCSTCPPLYQALVGVTESLGALHDPDSVVPPELAQRARAWTTQE